jgi:hypothetical protein
MLAVANENEPIESRRDSGEALSVGYEMVTAPSAVN